MKSFLFPSFPLSRKRFHRIHFYESQEVTALSSVPWSTLNPKNSVPSSASYRNGIRKSLSLQGAHWEPPWKVYQGDQPRMPLGFRGSHMPLRGQAHLQEHNNKTHLQKTMSIFFNEVISPHGCLPKQEMSSKARAVRHRLLAALFLNNHR